MTSQERLLRTLLAEQLVKIVAIALVDDRVKIKEVDVD